MSILWSISLHWTTMSWLVSFLRWFRALLIGETGSNILFWLLLKKIMKSSAIWIWHESNKKIQSQSLEPFSLLHKLFIEPDCSWWFRFTQARKAFFLDDQMMHCKKDNIFKAGIGQKYPLTSIRIYLRSVLIHNSPSLKP